MKERDVSRLTLCSEKKEKTKGMYMLVLLLLWALTYQEPRVEQIFASMQMEEHQSIENEMRFFKLNMSSHASFPNFLRHPHRLPLPRCNARHLLFHLSRQAP